MSNDGEVIGGACVSDAGVPVVIISSASKWIEFDSSCGFMEWRMSADDAFTLSNLAAKIRARFNREQIELAKYRHPGSK
jgi:hypothetical protein